MATVTTTAPDTRTFSGAAWSWITTVDHKRIAVLYLVTALGFFVMGGVEALLIRAQLARPDADVVSPDRYIELFTMHGTTMVFLVVMPGAAAFIFEFTIGGVTGIMQHLPRKFFELPLQSPLHDLIRLFQNPEKGFLRNAYLSNLFHSPFPLFLLLQQFPLAGDVTSITFGCHIFAEGTNSLPRYHFPTYSGLNSNFKKLSRY